MQICHFCRFRHKKNLFQNFLRDKGKVCQRHRFWDPESSLGLLRLSGSRKGVYLKGLFAQSRLFYREMDCPVRFYREMDCPVRWSLATPSALENQSRAEQTSVVANPICKCRRHKAGHLQVRVAVGKRSTCILKEAPLNKGPLGFPQTGKRHQSKVRYTE